MTERITAKTGLRALVACVMRTPPRRLLVSFVASSALNVCAFMILARRLDPRGFVDFIKHPAVLGAMIGGILGSWLGLPLTEFRQWRLQQYSAETERRMRSVRPRTNRN